MPKTKFRKVLGARRAKKRMSMRRLRAFIKRRSAMKKIILPKPSNMWSKKDVLLGHQSSEFWTF